jgi:hypothetical protein
MQGAELAQHIGPGGARRLSIEADNVDGRQIRKHHRTFEENLRSVRRPFWLVAEAGNDALDTAARRNDVQTAAISLRAEHD